MHYKKIGPMVKVRQGDYEAAQAKTRAAFLRQLSTIEDVAKGKPETRRQYSGQLDPSGNPLFVTVEVYPTHGDRLKAVKMLGDYGRIPSGAPEGPNGLDGADAGEVLKAVTAALRDPAVRRWVIDESPETLQALRLLMAEEVEVVSILPAIPPVASSAETIPGEVSAEVVEG